MQYLYIILFFFLTCSCNYVNSNNDSFNTDSFYNAINTTGYDFNKNNYLNLEYTVQTFDDSSIVKFYHTFSNGDTLYFEYAIGLNIYNEGDLNNDGYTEIGLMPAYATSSCRAYQIYTIKDNKFIHFKTINTHLPDRSIGVNYFRNMGDILRIIQVDSESCCQCLGLDTSFVPLNIN